MSDWLDTPPVVLALEEELRRVTAERDFYRKAAGLPNMTTQPPDTMRAPDLMPTVSLPLCSKAEWLQDERLFKQHINVEVRTSDGGALKVGYYTDRRQIPSHPNDAINLAGYMHKRLCQSLIDMWRETSE